MQYLLSTESEVWLSIKGHDEDSIMFVSSGSYGPILKVQQLFQKKILILLGA